MGACCWVRWWKRPTYVLHVAPLLSFLNICSPWKRFIRTIHQKNGRYSKAVRAAGELSDFQQHFPALDHAQICLFTPSRSLGWCGPFALLGRQLVMLKCSLISVKYELWGGLIWPFGALYPVASINVSLTLEPVCITEGKKLLEDVAPKTRSIPSSKLLDTKKSIWFFF